MIRFDFARTRRRYGLQDPDDIFRRLYLQRFGDEAPAEIKQYVRYGASPRAAQSIILAAKALALIDGRYSVAVDDLRRVAVPALNHRLILNFHGEMERVTATSLVERLVSSLGTP